MDATQIRNTVLYGARLEGDKGGTTIADASEDRGLIMDGCDRHTIDQEDGTEKTGPCDCIRSHVAVADWVGTAMWAEISGTGNLIGLCLHDMWDSMWYGQLTFPAPFASP
ncbi:AUX/IAA transcriptional regulator family protein [Pyrus ussuriensis x Pyrus communis]|uniref:AUX/IAA transcriptional regulator family protein n=1 Tax=Pyrus ussuriensis x Pyrus communis TaxID=2448454 RepID=A0A5N5IP61_9ROSA|nr:AUX/IAA transcriptional regulator family protein [Pyrus ussuriensis x Pyrus communis]